MAGSGWSGFLIEQKSGSRGWETTASYGGGGGDVAAGGGIRQNVAGTPLDLGLEIIDAYLEVLVATNPAYIDYLLYEDDDETMLRVRVWDIEVAYGERISEGWSVPEPGAPLSHLFPRSLSREGGEPASVVTLPAKIVRDRLHRKLAKQPPDPPAAGAPVGRPGA